LNGCLVEERVAQGAELGAINKTTEKHFNLRFHFLLQDKRGLLSTPDFSKPGCGQPVEKYESGYYWKCSNARDTLYRRFKLWVGD
jgi:hypothetical protein